MLPGVIAIISLFTVVVLSLVCIRVGTVALVQTGLSDQLAKFQSYSAFTTSGFTTAEAEQIMSHPLRRRIVSWLMIAGSVGVVSAGSSLVSILVSGQNQTSESLADQTWFRVTTLASGLVLLWGAAQSRWLDARLSQIIAWLLTKYTDLELRDYHGLLHMTGGYIVAELRVEAGDWLAGQSLIELALTKEGVLILGIEKPHGIYIGAPQGHTRVEAGDMLLVYGISESLDQLDNRRRGISGNAEHMAAVSRQQMLEEVEAKILEAAEHEDHAEVTVEIAAGQLERLREMARERSED